MGWFTQSRKDAKVGVIMINCELLIINEELFRVGAEYIQPFIGKGLVCDVEAIRELPLILTKGNHYAS
jgi:hypothetical protein